MALTKWQRKLAIQVAYRERPTVDVQVEHNLDRMIAGKPQLVSVELALSCERAMGAPTVSFGADADHDDFDLEIAVRDAILDTCSRGAFKGYPAVDPHMEVLKVSRLVFVATPEGGGCVRWSYVRCR